MSKKLTTAAECPVAVNQNVDIAGKHGPQLLQDVWFLEKLVYFDQEVILECCMHVESSAGYGILTVIHYITHGQKNRITFSFSYLCCWYRGDIRGFILRFYAEEGNLDLAGNNTPFFYYGIH